MAKRRLSDKDISQLLAHYRNERRQLTYQLDLVKAAIADLKQQKGEAGEDGDGARQDAAPVIAKRGPGRPRKHVETTKVPGKPGRPKKRERKERALNEWDNAVLAIITQEGLLMRKEELLKNLLEWAATHKPELTQEEVEAFLTRTLQKLSGKKKMLGTHHSGIRRGYHYGLMDWFFQSSGKLRRQHYDKLKLTDQVAEEEVA
ncbi:MAG TPA: hypothetical protein PKD45_09910 [Flavobacteriales bacterium]|nr:hypothetical protein [Flavobacteriales bacterium]